MKPIPFYTRKYCRDKNIEYKTEHERIEPVMDFGCRMCCTCFTMNRQPYPSDVTDEEWAVVAPYLILMREDAPQRRYELRELFNGLRWVVRTGSQWRMMPHDFPPWHAVYQQTRRWMDAGVIEAMIHDFRETLRLSEDRDEQPSAAILDGRTLRSTPESGGRAGYDGAKKKNGTKIHMAVDTAGRLIALVATPADEQERRQVYELCEEIQETAGGSAKVAFVDQGYAGEQARNDAAEHGIELVVVKLPEARKGFVLLPRRWVVERSFGWMSRFRRLARDCERLADVLVGFHFIAFTILMLKNVVAAIS